VPGDVLSRIVLIVVPAVMLCAFSIAWFQMFGSWSLFIERAVDRSVGSFVIPVPWFASINAAVVISVAPAVAALWVHLAARDRPVDIVQKYAFALSMAALAHGLMYASALGAANGSPASVWLPVLAFTVFAIGEIVAWTATYGFVARAAPPGFASVTMGAWYLLTLGLGGYLSGFTGHWVDAQGFPVTFGRVGGAMAVATVVALLMHGPLRRVAARIGVTL
jgi:POT family proton-dependent oligopeptide transporter